MRLIVVLRVHRAWFGVFVDEALGERSEQPGDKHRRPGFVQEIWFCERS